MKRKRNINQSPLIISNENHTTSKTNELEITHFLLENANSIILRWDNRGIIHYLNKFGADFFGYKKDQLLGKNVNILIPEQESTGRDLTSLVQDILNHHERHKNVPNENVTKSGKRVWVSWTNKAIVDENGIVQEILAIGNDITQLRKTEEKLRLEHEKLSAIVDNTSFGIGITDKHGNTISLNKAASKMFQNETAVFSNFQKYPDAFELQYPDGRKMPVRDWPTFKAFREEYVHNFEVKLVHNESQNKKFISFTTIPVYDYNGETSFIIFNMTDLTDHHQTENSLRIANQELKKLNDILNSLLYISAHDLKGPINNAKMIFSMMESMATDQEKVDMLPKLELIFDNLERTIKGLNGILEVQHVDKDSVKNIDLANLVKEKIAFFEEILGNSDFITYDFTAASEIRYVEPYLRSILRNLIGNAIKYRKPNEDLRISLQSKKLEDCILVTVEDNGIGMDLNMVKKDLFKPFKRFTHHVEGTGVGLYLIKNMISRNGGDIRVESEYGKGSTFYCYFKEYD